MAAYLIAAFFLLAIASALYITFSVKLTRYTTGDIKIRVGWTKYAKINGSMYEISDDFAYHERLIPLGPLNAYLTILTIEHAWGKPPEKRTTKRLLRRNFR